jgi:Na+/melibiose symporter-like transporter
MFELTKLAWDLVVLRDATSKGEMTWKVWATGFGFVIVLYGIGLPAVLLYEKHPEDKPVFVAAMVLIGILVVAYFWLAIRWRRRLRRERLAAAQNSEPAN